MPISYGSGSFNPVLFSAITPTENFAQKRQDRQQELIYNQAIAKINEDKLAKVREYEDVINQSANKAALVSAELPAPDAARARTFINSYMNKFQEEMKASGDPYSYFMKEGNNFNNKFIKDFTTSDAFLDGKLNKVTEASFLDDKKNGRFQREVKALDPASGEIISKSPEQAYLDYMSGKDRRLAYNGGYDQPDLGDFYKIITTTPNPENRKSNKVTFEQFKSGVLASDDPKLSNMTPEDKDDFIKREWQKSGKGLFWNNNNLNLQYDALAQKETESKRDWSLKYKQMQEQKALANMVKPLYDAYVESTVTPAGTIFGIADTYNLVKNSQEYGYALIGHIPDKKMLTQIASGNATGFVPSLTSAVIKDSNNDLISLPKQFTNAKIQANTISAVKYPYQGKPTTQNSILSTISLEDNEINRQAIEYIYGKGSLEKFRAAEDKKNADNEVFAPKGSYILDDIFIPITTPNIYDAQGNSIGNSSPAVQTARAAFSTSQSEQFGKTIK